MARVAKKTITKQETETEINEEDIEIYNNIEIPIVSGKYDNLIHSTEKSIIIDFDKIFDNDDISIMNELVLKKRSYYSISDIIINSMKLVFNSCAKISSECDYEALLGYLNIIVTIKDEDIKYPWETFMTDIRSLVLKDEIYQSISTYIDDNYVDEMDIKTEKIKQSKQINKELQFTDEHVKVILKSAEASRFVIPLVTQYCEENNYDVSDGLYETFCNIIKEYESIVAISGSGNKLNIKNKIHRFVYSRIVSTQYSDRVIWNVLTNKSKDVNVITLEFMKDILIGIIPKSELGKNIINFFHVVIKNKINFEFSRNYKISFKPINFNQVDSEGLTPFDKWEINMIKKNESKIIINQLSIEQQLTNIRRELGIKVTEKEYNYYFDKIIINSFQRNILFLFFAKYIGSYQNLYNASREQYIMMTITLYKWLLNNGYEYLPTYLIAKPDKLSEKRMNISKSRIYEQITNSKSYKDLLVNKFSFIEHNLEESNIIVKMIGNLNVSKFIEVDPYGKDSKKEDEEEEKIVDIKIENIGEEVLRFLKIV